MEQILLETTSKQMKVKEGIRRSQHQLWRENISVQADIFHDELTGLVHEGRAGFAVDFRKGFLYNLM